MASAFQPLPATPDPQRPGPPPLMVRGGTGSKKLGPVIPRAMRWPAWPSLVTTGDPGGRARLWDRRRRARVWGAV